MRVNVVGCAGDAAHHIVYRHGRILRQNEASKPRNQRAGHRGTTLVAIATHHAAENVYTGSGNINGVAVVGEVGFAIAQARGRHIHHMVVRCRIHGHAGVAVARCRNAHNARIVGRVDDVLIGGRVGPTAPAHANNIGTSRNGVLHATVGVGKAGRAVERNFYRHQLHVEAHGGHTSTIVGYSRSNARTVRTVRKVVGIGARSRIGVVVVVGCIPAVYIVNVAVVVIVNSVVGNFARVGPNVGRQIGMIQLHRIVYHANHHTVNAGAKVPGLLGIDRLQAPLLGL